MPVSLRAVRTKLGVLTNLGTLGANYSAAYGVNSAGGVVGAATRYARPRASPPARFAVNSICLHSASASDIRTSVREIMCGGSAILRPFALNPAGFPRSKYRMNVMPHTMKKYPLGSEQAF